MSKKIDDYRQLPNFQTKTIPTFVKSVDEAQGIVEHVVSVFGMVDDGMDIVMPGSFTKTIVERGGRVKVLDQHQTDSALRVVGRPLSLREIGRNELPQEVLNRFPDANGGLLATTQYAMKTDNGRNMFELISGGFLPETSIGYDALDTVFEKREIDGKEVTVRLLNTIRLWEYSNVIWGMCAATFTLSAKELNMEAGVGQAFNAWTQATDGTPLYQIVETGESSLIVEDGKVHRFRVPFEMGDGEITFAAVSEWTPEEQDAPDSEDDTPIEKSTPAYYGTKRNLSELVKGVAMAFYSQYRDTFDEVFWVKQIHDDFLIVDQEGLTTATWKIAYTSENDLINFAAKAEWMQVEAVFIPVTSETPPARDNELGAATFNLDIVVNASTSPEEIAAAISKALSHQEPPNEAGPDAEPPTSKRDELLAELEIQLAEIEQMEVT